MMNPYVAVATRLLQVQAGSAPKPLAGGIVPNPKPISPISGTGITTIMGYALWGTIITCGIVALVAGGLLAVGQLSHNPSSGDRGKRALLYSLGGVALAAVAIPTLNTVFGTVHATG